MPLIKYKDISFRQSTLAIINKANEIIAEYQADGLELTLRQLYYQFVSRDIIPNKAEQYDKLGNIISDARLTGLVDWNSIVDRTRDLKQNGHWDNASDILRSAARSFAMDKWEGQSTRCEVWIEKDALVGVIERPCRAEDVPFFACRGYVSQSEMWSAAMRLRRWITAGIKVVIFHLGDHDPSGVDMSRDIQERLNLLSNDAGIEVRRIALTMDQIEQYDPPPNPAKLSDSRCQEYMDKYGDESWELDALEPRVIEKLVTEHIRSVQNRKLWVQKQSLEKGEKGWLTNLADEHDGK